MHTLKHMHTLKVMHSAQASHLAFCMPKIVFCVLCRIWRRAQAWEAAKTSCPSRTSARRQNLLQRLVSLSVERCSRLCTRQSTTSGSVTTWKQVKKTQNCLEGEWNMVEACATRHLVRHTVKATAGGSKCAGKPGPLHDLTNDPHWLNTHCSMYKAAIITSLPYCNCVSTHYILDVCSLVPAGSPSVQLICTTHLLSSSVQLICTSMYCCVLSTSAVL